MINPGVKGKRSVLLINNEGHSGLDCYISTLQVENEYWFIYTKKKSLVSKEFKTQIFLQFKRELRKLGEVHYHPSLAKHGFSFGLHSDVVTELFFLGESGHSFSENIYYTLNKMKQNGEENVSKVLIFPPCYPLHGKVGVEDIEEYKDCYVEKIETDAS